MKSRFVLLTVVLTFSLPTWAGREFISCSNFLGRMSLDRPKLTGLAEKMDEQFRQSLLANRTNLDVNDSTQLKIYLNSTETVNRVSAYQTFIENGATQELMDAAIANWSRESDEVRAMIIKAQKGTTNKSTIELLVKQLSSGDQQLAKESIRVLAKMSDQLSFQLLIQQMQLRVSGYFDQVKDDPAFRARMSTKYNAVMALKDRADGGDAMLQLIRYFFGSGHIGGRDLGQAVYMEPRFKNLDKSIYEGKVWKSEGSRALLKKILNFQDVKLSDGSWFESNENTDRQGYWEKTSQFDYIGHVPNPAYASQKLDFTKYSILKGLAAAYLSSADLDSNEIHELLKSYLAKIKKAGEIHAGTNRGDYRQWFWPLHNTSGPGITGATLSIRDWLKNSDSPTKNEDLILADKILNTGFAAQLVDVLTKFKKSIYAREPRQW